MPSFKWESELHHCPAASASLTRRRFPAVIGGEAHPSANVTLELRALDYLAGACALGAGGFLAGAATMIGHISLSEKEPLQVEF